MELQETFCALIALKSWPVTAHHQWRGEEGEYLVCMGLNQGTSVNLQALFVCLPFSALHTEVILLLGLLNPKLEYKSVADATQYPVIFYIKFLQSQQSRPLGQTEPISSHEVMMTCKF